MREQIDRRQFVRGVGAVTVAGALAGCSGGGGDDGGNGGDGTTTESGDGGGDTTTEGSSGGEVPEAVTSYLSDTSNFDGSVTDETGSDSVTVTVGAEGNDGNFAFAPAAIRVSSGTTVTWEWNGEGGQHNVVAEEGGDFESELTAEEGFTFEHTFESTGVVTYYCSPHQSLGMKGAVIVE
jgi:halocyanin-like protein